MPSFLLPCTEGLEDVVAADALDLGATRATAMTGRVLAEAPREFLYRANLAHPTASRVQLVLAEGDVATLDDARRLVAEVAWEEVFDPALSFACDSVRVGAHSFTSHDLARAAGDAVLARFRAAADARPRVDLNRPDVDIMVQVRDGGAWVAVDTTGPSLHLRPWRRYQHPAALPATVASAMVRLSGWARGTLVDPMCGGGTIPIEADFRARGRAVNLGRAAWPFERLRLHDPEAHERARDAAACGAADEPPGDILGIERHAAHAAGARENAAAAGAGARVRLHRADLADAPRPAQLAALVANPPWGLRLGDRDTSRRALRLLREKMDDWAREGPFRAVVLVGAAWTQKEMLKPTTARAVKVGGADVRLLVLDA